MIELPDQEPRHEPPSTEVPVPTSNAYKSVAEEYIDGMAIDKLLREARYLLYLYHDINMSPEWPRIVNSLKDWRQTLAYAEGAEAAYWLRQISKVLPRRRMK